MGSISKEKARGIVGDGVREISWDQMEWVLGALDI